MREIPRLTPQTVEVLRALLAKPTQARYGRELGQELGMKSGSLHPILARLELAGLVESFWEEPEAHEDQGRPRRRYYQFTPDGAERTRLALAAATPSRASGVRARTQPGY